MTATLPNAAKADLLEKVATDPTPRHLDSVAADFGLLLSEAQAIVQARWPRPESMTKAAGILRNGVPTRTTTVTPTAVPKPAPVPSAPVGPAQPGVGRHLLAVAAKSGKVSTRKLGERIDTLLADLQRRVESEQAEKRERARLEAERAKARDEVKRLREQLAAAEKLLGKQPKASNGEAAKIRAWARENGYEVPTRGQVAASIRDAYAAAQGGAS